MEERSFLEKSQKNFCPYGVVPSQTIFPGLVLLTACRGDGSEGVPVPPPLDVTELMRRNRSHDALAARAKFQPPANIVTRHYDQPLSSSTPPSSSRSC